MAMQIYNRSIYSQANIAGRTVQCDRFDFIYLALFLLFSRRNMNAVFMR